MNSQTENQTEINTAPVMEQKKIKAKKPKALIVEETPVAEVHTETSITLPLANAVVITASAPKDKYDDLDLTETEKETLRSADRVNKKLANNKNKQEAIEKIAEIKQKIITTTTNTIRELDAQREQLINARELAETCDDAEEFYRLLTESEHLRKYLPTATKSKKPKSDDETGEEKERSKPTFTRPANYAALYIPAGTQLKQTIKDSELILTYDGKVFYDQAENVEYSTLRAANIAHAQAMELKSIPDAWKSFKTLDGQSIYRLDLNPL